MSVYFVLQTNTVKIGFTKDVRARLKGLQTSTSIRLSLLGEVDGDRALERAIHRRLVQHRVVGEWFVDCDEVRHVINDVMKRGVEAVAEFYEPILEREEIAAPIREPDPRLALQVRLVAMAQALAEAAEDERMDVDAVDLLFEKVVRTFERWKDRIRERRNLGHAELLVNQLQTEVRALLEGAESQTA